MQPETLRWVLSLKRCPWSRQFFQPSGKATGTREGRPSIRSTEELKPSVRPIGRYVETLLQCQPVQQQHRFGFHQELFTRVCCSAIPL